MFEDLIRDMGQGPPDRESFNALLRRLESLVPLPGPGMLMRRTSSGTLLFPQVRGGRGIASDPGQFAVSLTEKESGWVATVRPGWVRFTDARNTGTALEEAMPDGMDSDPLPEHAVSAGDALYCRVATDEKGYPTDIYIDVGDVAEESTHHQPPTADDSGTVGDYYYCLAEFEMAADGVTLTAIQIQAGGPITHVSSLWEGKNIGDGIDVLKQRNSSDDAYEFRRIKQLEIEDFEDEEEPVPIIVPEDDQPDQIELRALIGKVISGADEPLLKVKASSDGKAIEFSPDGWRGNVTVPSGTLEIVGGMVNKFQEATDLPANFDMMVREVDIEVYDVPGGFEAYTTPRISDQLLYRVRNGIILRGGTHLPGTPTIVIETTHVSGPAPPAG
jgi:hypothetical protein